MGKGSKNSIENRGKKIKVFCENCEKEITHVMIFKDSKKCMGKMCDCGVYNNVGELLN